MFIDPNLHIIIKLKAAERNISMQDYVIQAILKRIEEEKNHE